MAKTDIRYIDVLTQIEADLDKVPEHRSPGVSDEAEAVGGPALDHGAGAVLGEGQQDAHTGVQVLRGAQAADIPVHGVNIR